MTWLDDVYARHVAGDHPGELYQLYEQHRAAEDRQQRLRGLTKDQARLADAWECCDYDRATDWLTDDREHLTPEATRLLLDAWDAEDAASA